MTRVCQGTRLLDPPLIIIPCGWYSGIPCVEGVVDRSSEPTEGMTVMAKPRIETQIRRRKKTAGLIELQSEWEAQQGIRTTGLKMTSDAMMPKKPAAPDSGKPSSA